VTGHFDRNGEPISHERFVELMNDLDYRVLGQEQVGPYYVSTCWIGWNMAPLASLLFGHPPRIFETAVTGCEQQDPPVAHFDVRRYSTEAEALEGHTATVLLIQATALYPEPEDHHA
jgi:hypothetical protein